MPFYTTGYMPLLFNGEAAFWKEKEQTVSNELWTVCSKYLEMALGNICKNLELTLYNCSMK